MYSKKKQPKVMINGWRAAYEIAGELKMLELSEAEKHGTDFVKAEMMDAIIRFGMAGLKDGKVITPQDMMLEPVKEKKAPVKRFIKPSLEEVEPLFKEAGKWPEDASSFYDHYESNGWKVGKNPMKDWKAAARNWMKRSYANSSKPDQSGFLNNDSQIIDGHVVAPSQAGFLEHEQ